MKSNKFKIVILIAGMLLGIALTIFLAVKNPGENKKAVDEPKQKEIDAIVKEASGKTEEEVAEMTEDEKEGFLYGDGKTYTDNKFRIATKTKEYPEIDGRNLLPVLVDYAEVASYDKIINEVSNIVNKYNLTDGSNLRIASIYHDASIMMTTLTLPDIQKGKIARGMKDPEMMVIGTLMLPELSRRDVITDKLSLSPIFDGAVKILSHEVLDSTTTDEYAIKLDNAVVGTEFIHKIEIEIENRVLYAYVAEFKNATLELYGIYAPKGADYHYQTIEFWEDIDAKYYKNN